MSVGSDWNPDLINYSDLINMNYSDLVNIHCQLFIKLVTIVSDLRLIGEASVMLCDHHSNRLYATS